MDMDDGFVWSRSLPLSHPAIPAITALVYLAACAAHNTWRVPSRAAHAAERVAAKSVPAAGISWLDGAAVVHNALLVGFSALVHRFVETPCRRGLMLTAKKPPPCMPSCHRIPAARHCVATTPRSGFARPAWARCRCRARTTV